MTDGLRVQAGSTVQDDELPALRAKLAGLEARPCAMAHERIVRDADGLPVSSSRSDTGYRRPGICPLAVRNDNLVCSHTSIRLVLLHALEALGEAGTALLGEFHAIDGAIGLLDHRRYDAEARRADAIRAGDAGAVSAAEAAIAALVEEHHGLARSMMQIRDAAISGLDAVSSAVPVA